MVERMQAGQIEETHYPRNPLDVLCQQIVAMNALDEWKLDDLADVVRSSAPFAELSDEVLASVLDLLSGRYPSEEFAELRPRLVWDRVQGMVRGRTGAQRLAVTNPGTIPDRGLFTVTLPDGTRVGELDEEMVYESRPGETFLLGASTWRIEDITFQKVIVTPAPGQPGKMPFWHGDGPGRPLELGRAIGAFTRELRSGAGDPIERLRAGGLDDRAATNLVAYLDEQAEATGVVPDDRTIVVERFRDEIGDWRVCVLSPFGAQVHAPWAMALQHRLGERWGLAVELMWSDDGIVIRLPESVDELPDDELLIDPDEIEELIVSQLPGHRDVRLEVPGVRGARAAPPEATARPAHAAVAAAPAVGRPALGRRPLPELPDPPRGHPRVPQRRLRRARPRRGPARPALAQDPSRLRRLPAWRRRSRSRSCSGGSPCTCTRATLRSPSAGRPRWPSTATCCATCSVPRSSASSSTPMCWPTSSSSSSAWSTVAPPATPTRRTTSSGCSDRCRSTSSGCDPSTAPR